jgi:hypothetical protein
MSSSRILLPIFRLGLATSLLLAPSFLGFAAEEKDAPSDTGHREAVDDPPVKLDRRLMRRAPSTSVVRGNHVSVQVNVDASGNNIVGDAANEPSMAVDPTDPSNLVIGWRQFDTVSSNFRQAGYAYSHDAGASWTFPGVLEPGQFRSDPVLAADLQGTFYYYSLSAVDSAEMFISSDKGASWVGPFPGYGGDKEWMNVDVSASPGSGHVYTLWNSQFTCCAPGTDFTRSVDGGFMYEGPYAAPTKVKWGTLDVDSEGTLYLVGANLSNLSTPSHYVLRSSNAQNPASVPTFELITPIDLGGVTVTGRTPNPGGLMGQIWIAANRSSGSEADAVYVLASVDPPGADPLDVKFVRSLDGGETWSPPVRVNHDPADNLAYQWFGAISVAPNGRIDVTWYDTRNDPSALTSEVYYAYSVSGGGAWSDGLPVTPAFNSVIGYPNQNKIGDYTHMVSDSSGASLAFAATFNGEQDVWFVRVGDCNANGVHDSSDIASGRSIDCDHSGHPDECEELSLVEICDDGVDNDCNGFTDCDDPGCDGDPACQCDFDGVCEPGENCDSCPTDCPTVPRVCGDGICDPGVGEDCLDCPQDCAGLQSGNPNLQYCCGDAGSGANNPIGCPDPRCNEGDFVCIKNIETACCGDLTCEGGETPCSCELDCGPVSATETQCLDAIDNDCDGPADCADDDCALAAPPPPEGAPLLFVATDELGPVLSWQPPPGGSSFDVVVGDLDLLRAGAGFTAATSSCVVDGYAGLDLHAPSAAGDVWYLVRPVFCSGAVGSYDSGALGQVAPRDAAIDASGASCP